MSASDLLYNFIALVFAHSNLEYVEWQLCREHAFPVGHFDLEKHSAEISLQALPQGKVNKAG